MAQYYDFAGQKIILPGAYTQRKFPVDQGAGAVTGLSVIMGEAAKGGIPYTAFDDAEDVINVIDGGQSQALEVFGGGDVYYGAEFFLTPHKDERFNKPSVANCIVVNQMTKASTELDASANPIIDISSIKYGTDGNTMAVKVSTGTNTGKLVQILYKGSEILKQDDVTLALMSVLYTGAAATATMTITATKLTTSCAATPADDLDITLADYSDIGSLINFINTQANYTCLLTGLSDELPNVFDAVTAVNIKSSYSCVGIVEAIIRLLNGTGAVLAALHAAAARTVPDNLSEYQYFTGGTVSAATTADWTAALVKLEKYNINNIVCMSGSETIHLLVQDHCERMNSIQEKMYRQAGFGAGSVQTTKALRIAEMKALNSAYIEYCVSSFKRYDYVNKVADATFLPYYLYAMIAGFRYSNNVGMDIVFKYLNVLSTPEISTQDKKDYAAAGATFIQKTANANNENNFEIKCNNTTFQGSQVTRTNPSVVYSINVLTKDYEEQIIEKIRALDSVANSVIISTIQNWITTFLFPKYRDDYKWITNGPDGQLAFSGVSFVQDGEQFITYATLTMSVTPRFAFNFFTFIVPGQNI